LGRDAALSQATVHRYLNLLETSYQIVRLPAFARSHTRRLIKSPKLYWVDTGLAAFLSGLSGPDEVRDRSSAGALLENLVLAQILAWREIEFPRPEVSYWRTVTGAEVDLVLEAKRSLLPIEVKASRRVRAEDGRGLEAFLDEHAKQVRVGLLLYDGKEIFPLSPRVLAAPVGSVL
jgi:predicted AAA+ superfamily ATPase